MGDGSNVIEYCSFSRFTFTEVCKYLYYSISVDISYKLALIWIIERSVSFQKSALAKKKTKNKTCEKGDTGNNTLNAPFK